MRPHPSPCSSLCDSIVSRRSSSKFSSSRLTLTDPASVVAHVVHRSFPIGVKRSALYCGFPSCNYCKHHKPHPIDHEYSIQIITPTTWTTEYETRVELVAYLRLLEHRPHVGSWARAAGLAILIGLQGPPYDLYETEEPIDVIAPCHIEI